MRIPFVAANWKMFKTVHEAVVFAKQFRPEAEHIEDVEIVVAPPFTAVHAVAEALRHSNVGVAGQNLCWAKEGAFTGEISAGMLSEAGARYVIIGHSERRRLFGETDGRVHDKTVAALTAGLTPIVCVGETLEEREAGRTLDVLDTQLRGALQGDEATDSSGAADNADALAIDGERVAGIVMAYEPVWAIGTGRNATPAQAGEVHGHLRGRVREMFGDDVGGRTRIIYGGSVKPGNVAELAAEAEIDGALVGGASLEVESFLEIVVKSRPPAI